MCTSVSPQASYSKAGYAQMVENLQGRFQVVIGHGKLVLEKHILQSGIKMCPSKQKVEHRGHSNVVDQGEK